MSTAMLTKLRPTQTHSPTLSNPNHLNPDKPSRESRTSATSRNSQSDVRRSFTSYARNNARITNRGRSESIAPGYFSWSSWTCGLVHDEERCETVLHPIEFFACRKCMTRTERLETKFPGTPDTNPSATTTTATTLCQLSPPILCHSEEAFYRVRRLTLMVLATGLMLLLLIWVLYEKFFEYAPTSYPTATPTASPTLGPTPVSETYTHAPTIAPTHAPTLVPS